MLRYKHFRGVGNELEAAVNAWLADFEPDVTQMVQTSNPDGTISLSMLFEESFRSQERRLSASYGVPTPGRAPASTLPDEPLQVPVEPGTPQDTPGP